MKNKRHTKTKRNHMGKPRWGNGTTNRLHINKPQVQKRSNQSKRSKRMASEHGTTTQSHQNGHKTQAHEKLQKNQPPETGMQIKYDLTELREDPQKTERWLTQREEPPRIPQQYNSRRRLGK